MMQYFIWGIEIKSYKKLLGLSAFTSIIFAITSFFLALMQPNKAFAEPLPQRINFQHLLENKDIALGEVQAFLQDSQGFMWIGGGGGLVRYDGYEFKFVLQTVQTEKGAEKKPIKMVNYIYEDTDHTLWVLTRTGLYRYNPVTELLTPVPDDPTASAAISTVYFSDATELPDGELLFATSHGMVILDKKTNKYDVRGRDSAEKDWLIHLKSVYLDQSHSLWFGSSGGLTKFDWVNKTFVLFKPYPEQPDLVDPNTVNDIISDKDGTLWLGTSDGLVHFDPVTLKSTRYAYDAGDPNSLAGKEIAKLLIDSTGALWIASDGGGIAIFEKTEQFPQGRFTNHKFQDGRASSLSSNQVRTLYEDRTGDIWVGNYPAGINYFDRSSAAITTYTHDTFSPNSLSNNAILAVREDANGNLWLGTDGGGLNFFDREKNQFTRHMHDPANEKSLSGNAVLDAVIDHEGKIWAGTWGGGISVFDPASGEFDRTPFDAAREKIVSVSTSTRLNNSTVWSIIEDRQNNIWIGTHSGGLSKFDRKTETFTHYMTVFSDPSSISGGPVWSILEDSKNNIWVGTATGLDLLDRSTGAFTHFKADPQKPNSLSNPSATALFEDSKQRLWVGTEAGLNLLNPDGKTFTIYDKSFGFNDDNVRTIIEDSQGNLWIATNNGISVFDPETKKVKNYNRDGGQLMGGFHTGSGVVSSKGEIIFGGVEGLRMVDPKKLTENKIVPPIAFTGFKIYADSVNVGDADGLLTQSLNHTSTIVLDYQKTMFQFGFTALNFRDSNKNSYAYTLEGFDKSWLQVGDQRSAKYTNLNAGTYVFRVKGSNNDGTWNDQGATITVVQLPPPWKTWWAYTLYLLTIIAIIALFIHSQRIKRHLVEEQNRLLEIKVFERTAELREKNNDIQTLLSNMRQGLFAIEANGNIHPEYSHFLEEIFETKKIAGHNALELLFAKATLGCDTFDQIKQSMSSIIGEDQINYSFNAHLLVEEYEANVDGKAKFLSLDWNPVVVGNITTKLMVSVRDVTQLKKMENEARIKKRELDIIGQLLNIPVKKYQAFSESVKHLMAANLTQLEHNEKPSDAIIALLFRNMHTIKGNCRTFGFEYLSDVVHDVESVYSALKTQPDTNWDRDMLLSDLGRVEDMLQEYEDVYYNVLGRKDNGGEQRDQNGFWADSKTIAIIQDSVDAAHQQYPILYNTQPLLPIQSLLNRALSNPISEILADIINSLPSIAIQLNKEIPNVIIEDNQVRIKFGATELMTNIFAHILRNSIDHGIETAEVRGQAGKPIRGTIAIRAVTQQQCLHIHIKDDGQGINIDKLFQKGIETGKWKTEDMPSYSDIANLIFASGVSTKTEITTISGRGVGMDAVKEFLLAQNGNISLQILAANANETNIGSGAMIPFELIVELPQSIYIEAA